MDKFKLFTQAWPHFKTLRRWLRRLYGVGQAIRSEDPHGLMTALGIALRHPIKHEPMAKQPFDTVTLKYQDVRARSQALTQTPYRSVPCCAVHSRTLVKMTDTDHAAHCFSEPPMDAESVARVREMTPPSPPEGPSQHDAVLESLWRVPEGPQPTNHVASEQQFETLTGAAWPAPVRAARPVRPALDIDATTGPVLKSAKTKRSSKRKTRKNRKTPAR